MKGSLGYFDRLVVPVLGWVSAILLMLLMVLTCVDVISRYFLNHSLQGVQEVTEILLALLIFAGLPLVTLNGEHVTVDLFDAITPKWLIRVLRVLADLMCFVCSGYLCWQLWRYAEKLGAAGQTTSALSINVSYHAHAMAFLMGLTALAFVVLVIRRPNWHDSAVD